MGVRLVMASVVAVPAVGVVGYQSIKPESELYGAPIAQAYQRLYHMKGADALGTFMVAETKPELVKTAVPNRSVTWTWRRRDGVDLGHIRVDLDDAGEAGTRIAFSHHAEEVGPYREQARLSNRQGLGKAHFRIHLREKIASTVLDREYDGERVSREFADYTLSHPQALMQFGYDMTREQYDPRLNGYDDEVRARRASANHQALPVPRYRSVKEQMEAASKPALELPESRDSGY
jgi:hypothetical protein